MKVQTEINKSIVNSFNKDFIEGGNIDCFKNYVAENVINHSSPPGLPNDGGSITYFVINILRKGFPDLKVEISHQMAEGDWVTTRKILHATHTGDFMSIRPTHKKVRIEVIELIRIEDGKYRELWSMSNLKDVAEMLAAVWDK